MHHAMANLFRLSDGISMTNRSDAPPKSGMAKRRNFMRHTAAHTLATWLTICAAYADNSPTLYLQDAITMALATSPRVDAASAAVAVAVGSEKSAHSLPNPQLSVTAENFAGTRNYAGFQGMEHSYSLTELIELGGKRSARQDVAHAERRAAEAGTQMALQDVICETTRAYMQTVAAELLLIESATQEKSARDLQAQVNRRVQAARDPLFQRNSAAVSVNTARVAYERNLGTLQVARSNLSRLIGVSVLNSTLSEAEFTTTRPPQALKTYLAALDKSPHRRLWQHIRDARDADMRLAEAGAVPDIQAGIGMRKFTENGGSALIANLSLPIPVFNQNQGDIARTAAALRKTEAERRQLFRDQEQQLVQLWTDWQSAWNEIQTIRTRTMPEAEKACHLASEGFQRGGFTYLDVLNTQRSLSEVRIALISAQLRLQEAQADISRLTASTADTLHTEDKQ